MCRQDKLPILLFSTNATDRSNRFRRIDSSVFPKVRFCLSGTSAAMPSDGLSRLQRRAGNLMQNRRIRDDSRPNLRLAATVFTS